MNADDYGYFRCVSRGILESASRGVVTATGILANGPEFVEHVAWLRDVPELDTGVHLNLTAGRPLTADLQKRLSRWSGHFPGKGSAAMAVMSGAMRAEDVKREWRAQIERCREQGLAIRFLNSHEHIHLLPALFRVVMELAEEFGVPHVRLPTARVAWRGSAGAFIRGAAIRALGALNGPRVDGLRVGFLGIEKSGRLDAEYLEQCVSQMRPGGVYELMCHPGHFDEREVTEARLVRYHDWEGELRTLTDPRVREMLERNGVRLIGYRHLGSGQREQRARRNVAPVRPQP